jgi:hypothetical protein
VCLTPVLVCVGIAFSPYIVAVVCLVHALLSETDNNEEGIKKFFDKSQWRVNDNLLNAFHKMLFFPYTYFFSQKASLINLAQGLAIGSATTVWALCSLLSLHTFAFLQWPFNAS